MANLKSGTLIGGNMIWNTGNMPLRVVDSKLFINTSEVYTTTFKPTPADVGALPISGGTLTGTTLTFGDSAGVIRATALPHTNKQVIHASGAGTYLGNPNVQSTLESSERIKISQGTARGFIYDTINKPTAADVGAVNKAGDTMTSSLKISGASGSLNTIPSTDQLKLDGFGMIGNRGAVYVTNGSSASNATIQLGIGGIHSHSNKLTVEVNKITSFVDLYERSGRVYSPANKPTAADVGAVPLTSNANITIQADSDKSTTSEYAAILSGHNELRVTSSGGGSTVTRDNSKLTFNGSPVYNEGFKPFRVHSIGKPSGLTDGRYYPVVISGAEHNQQVYISTRQSGMADPMNNSSFSGEVRAMGWSDGDSYAQGLHTNYDNERAIHSIYDLSESTGTYAFYVEARAFPIVVRVDSSCTVNAYASNTTVNGGTFNAGLTSDQLTNNQAGTKIRLLKNFDEGTGFYYLNGNVNSNAMHIKASVDLDGYDVGGIYNLYKGSGVTFTNAPSDFDYGTLQVIGRGRVGASFVTQILTWRSDGRQMIRTRSDGSFVWTAWKKIYSESQKPTPADVGAVNKTGDTMTGNLIINKTGDALRVGSSYRATMGVSSVANEALFGVANDGSNLSNYVRVGASLNTFTFSIGGAQHRIYTTGSKPSPADVGALPISGGTLTGTTLTFGDSAGVIRATALPHTNKQVIHASGAGTYLGNPNVQSTLESSERIKISQGTARGFIYDTINKPTAADVGALPIGGGVLTGQLQLKDGQKSALAVHNGSSIRFSDGDSAWMHLIAQGSALKLFSGGDSSLSEHISFKHPGVITSQAKPQSMNEGTYNGTTEGGVWRRGQGVYHAKVTHSGSSWAPMFSGYFHNTDGYAGYYSIGHLAQGGANSGTFCVSYMTDSGGSHRYWAFNGSNGDFTSPGNVVAYSDVRVKSNIETIENALDKIDQIRGVTYDRTDMDTSRQMGVIAQEVEKVAPEVVTTSHKGDIEDFKAVAYGNLSALLIEGIKELRSELTAIKSHLGL